MFIPQVTALTGGLFCLLLRPCAPLLAANNSDDIAELRRAIRALEAQNRVLMKRLSDLEVEKSWAQKRSPVVTGQSGSSGETAGRKGLEERVHHLEATLTAHEDATRSIIRDAISTTGSKINESVTLGGSLEVATGWNEDFSGRSEGALALNSAQLDLEIQVNDWTLGSLVLEYDDGGDAFFRSTDGSEASIDRVNIDTAFLVVGDTQRFPLFGKFGRMILPFGISTGDPVADVLTVEDPMTIEIFEMRRNAIGFGLEFPTPVLRPPTPPIALKPVRPLLLNPLVNSLSRRFGYSPPPARPIRPTYFAPSPTPPPFNVGIYFYDGDTFSGKDKNGWEPADHFSATIGFRAGGNCGRPYHQLRDFGPCPWTLDIDADYISSVFDSRFLAREYQVHLGQIGIVSGVALSVKATLGRVSLVGEWNGALGETGFSDDSGNTIVIKPSAWQLSLGYQFDWNPWVESIGAQGTYLAIGYSESRGLAGFTRLLNGESVRVGRVPKKRFLLSMGEWISDGLKFAVEYAREWDYSTDDGGTGSVSNRVSATILYVW